MKLIYTPKVSSPEIMHVKQQHNSSNFFEGTKKIFCHNFYYTKKKNKGWPSFLSEKIVKITTEKSVSLILYNLVRQY